MERRTWVHHPSHWPPRANRARAYFPYITIVYQTCQKEPHYHHPLAVASHCGCAWRWCRPLLCGKCENWYWTCNTHIIHCKCWGVTHYPTRKLMMEVFAVQRQCFLDLVTNKAFQRQITPTLKWLIAFDGLEDVWQMIPTANWFCCLGGNHDWDGKRMALVTMVAQTNKLLLC